MNLNGAVIYHLLSAQSVPSCGVCLIGCRTDHPITDMLLLFVASLLYICVIFESNPTDFAERERGGSELFCSHCIASASCAC